jgi:hypothetical protein
MGLDSRSPLGMTRDDIKPQPVWEKGGNQNLGMAVVSLGALTLIICQMQASQKEGNRTSGVREEDSLDARWRANDERRKTDGCRCGMTSRQRLESFFRS